MPTSTTAGCPPSVAGPTRPPSQHPDHPTFSGPPPLPPGPKSLFSEPGGLPGLLALTVPEPLGGWWWGDGGPAGLSRLPPNAAFPCGDLRGCLRIYFHFVIISL